MTGFTDLYLRASTREELDAALEAAGLAEGSAGVQFDWIGPFQRLVGYEGEDGEGDPIWATFAAYHANLRVDGALTAEQHALLAPFAIALPDTPFRRWAD